MNDPGDHELVQMQLHQSFLSCLINNLPSRARHVMEQDLNTADNLAILPYLSLIHLMIIKDFDDCIRMLFHHPQFNVNYQLHDGYGTPLTVACWFQREDLAILFLSDDRIDVSLEDAQRHRAMFSVILSNLVRVLEMWICFGRFIDVEKDLPTAHFYNKPDIINLLTRYRHDRGFLKYQLQVKHGGWGAPELYALVIFFCDRLLRIRSTGHPPPDHKRFFRIISRLPMEIQQRICHRATGSAEESVPGHLSEYAFRNLASSLLSS